MIDFRYHVISIVAIFLALATGIALGAGPLRGEFSQALAEQADRDREAKEDLRAEVDSLEDQNAWIDEVSSLLGTRLTENRLEGRSVTILALPDASADDVAGVEERITGSGGSVASTVTVEPRLLDPANRQLAEGLATSVLEEVPDVGDLEGASSYQLVGTTLARGLLAEQPGGDSVDDPARTILEAFTAEEAGFLTADDEVQRRGGLAVIVAGPPSGNPIAGQDELLATLAQSMDATSGGVVVVGPTSAADTDGYVAAVRDSDAAESVSTVDTVQTATGRLVTVLALAQQAGGEAGQYGVAADDPPLSDLISP